MPPRRAAFFDVDETLLVVRSMFRFLAFHLARRGADEADYLAAEGELRRMVAAGEPREDVNRAYYRLFAGRDAAALADHGRAWFTAECALGSPFHPEVLAAFRAHAAAGDLTVLVSGSFSACLDPVARYVGADVVLCTVPRVRRGRLTGDVVAPLIGAAKGDAVRELAARHGIDLAGSSAYGDHASDLPLLTAVGRPVVVGDDPVLGARGWTTLPGATDPSDRPRWWTATKAAAAGPTASARGE